MLLLFVVLLLLGLAKFASNEDDNEPDELLLTLMPLVLSVPTPCAVEFVIVVVAAAC